MYAYGTCFFLVSVFSVMWFELLMTSAISCPLWSSVCECQRVECVSGGIICGCGGCCDCDVCTVVCVTYHTVY